MIIYKATNLLNGHYYIGQTIQTLELRKSAHLRRAHSKDWGHNSYFYQAIRKYGAENFSWSVVAEATTKEELDILEAYYIDQTPDGMSYNLIPGGRRNPMDELAMRLAQSEKVIKSSGTIAASVRNLYKTGDMTERKKNLSKAMMGNSNGNKYVISVLDTTDSRTYTFGSFVEAGKYMNVSAPAVRQHWRRVNVGGGDLIAKRYRVVMVEEVDSLLTAEDASKNKYYFRSLAEAISKLGLEDSNATRSAINRAIEKSATSRGYKWSRDKG